MADGSSTGFPFELSRLKELIALMEEHDLSEVDLHNGDQRCKLRRGPENVSMVAGPMAYATAPAPMVAAGVPSAPTVPSAAVNDGTTVIKSPTVGTFYATPSPDDPPFVAVGTHVNKDTVVCLIEAMKVYNQITADLKGTIVEVLVNNADVVEFGQPLFRVKPD